MHHRYKMFRSFALACLIVLGSTGAQAQGNVASLRGSQEGPDPIRWLADANVGALRLQSSDFQVAGDLTLGIGQSWWGFVGWGSGSAYDLKANQVESDTTKLEGSAEAWLNTGNTTDAFRLTVRATGGGVNYSSTVIDRTGGGRFNDQDSWMGRGSLLVGGLFHPSPSFSAHLSIGGGIQFEWYDYTSAVAGATTVDDTQDLSFMGDGRLDLRWVAVQDVISLRARASAIYFKLNRTNDFLGYTGTLTQEVTTTSFGQLEICSRGFVDLDVASFYGFRPTIHGGVDYLRITGEGENESTMIPVFGAGLLYPWI